MGGERFLGELCLSIFGLSFWRAVLCSSFPEWFFREATRKAHCNRGWIVSSTLATVGRWTHMHSRTEFS